MTSYSLTLNLASLITFLNELRWETLVPLMLDLAAISIYLMLLRALRKFTKEGKTQKQSLRAFLPTFESFSDTVIQILRKHFLTEASNLQSESTSQLQQPQEQQQEQLQQAEAEIHQLLNDKIEETVQKIKKEFDINE